MQKKSIRSNARKIKSSMAQSSLRSAKITSRVRYSLIEMMEKMLGLEVEDQNQKIIPINFGIIHSKALKLYEYLKQEKEDSLTARPFLASKKWFDTGKFRMCRKSNSRLIVLPLLCSQISLRLFWWLRGTSRNKCLMLMKQVKFRNAC